MANANRPARTIPSMQGPSSIRCSYVFLAEPQSVNGGDPKYQVTMMFDKKDPEHMAAVKQLAADLKAISEEQWPDVSKRPRTLIIANKPHTGPKSPIKDGDVAVNSKGIPLNEANPEYAGHFIVTATAAAKVSIPPVVDARGATIDRGLCRSGFWYKVNINPYSYTAGGGGVAVGLNGVQFIREDEVLGGGAPSISNMFETSGSDAGVSDQDFFGSDADDDGDIFG